MVGYKSVGTVRSSLSRNAKRNKIIGDTKNTLTICERKETQSQINFEKLKIKRADGRCAWPMPMYNLIFLSLYCAWYAHMNVDYCFYFLKILLLFICRTTKNLEMKWNKKTDMHFEFIDEMRFSNARVFSTLNGLLLYLFSSKLKCNWKRWGKKQKSAISLAILVYMKCLWTPLRIDLIAFDLFERFTCFKRLLTNSTKYIQKKNRIN